MNPSEILVKAAIKLVGRLKIQHCSDTYDCANRGYYYTTLKFQYKFCVELPEKILNYFSRNNNFEWFANCKLGGSLDRDQKDMVKNDNPINIFVEEIGYWGSNDGIEIEFDIYEINKIPDKFYETYSKLVDDSSVDKKKLVEEMIIFANNNIILDQLESGNKIIKRELDNFIINDLYNIVRWYYLGEYYHWARFYIP
jgi:hypothetical protein